MAQTAAQTIADFYAAGAMPGKPGAGNFSEWAWRGREEDHRFHQEELYAATKHQEELAAEARWEMERAAVEARKVELEDQIVAALLAGNRQEARRLISRHYHADEELWDEMRSYDDPEWCGDPECCW